LISTTFNARSAWREAGFDSFSTNAVHTNDQVQAISQVGGRAKSSSSLPKCKQLPQSVTLRVMKRWPRQTETAQGFFFFQGGDLFTLKDLMEVYCGRKN
jgi:hypothetical protein